MVLLPDGRTLVTGDAGGSVRFWDASASSREPIHTQLRVSFGIGSPAGLGAESFATNALDPRVVRRSGFGFTPNSRGVITPDTNGSLALRDARSLRITENLPALGSNHWSAALSPDGRWLAAGKTSGTLAVWDWTCRRAVTNFAFPFEWFGELRFSRSGRYFIARAVRNDQTARLGLWRTSGWKEVPLTGRQFGGLWAAEFSPDDRLLAAGYLNGAVKLFRFPSEQIEVAFTNHSGAVSSMHFSPDGRLLASTSMDGSARLWDVVARREVAPLRGHLGCIFGGALSPDGRRLATGGLSSRDAVKLWDVAAHRELLSLQAEGLCFHDLTFSPDGNTLAATSMGGLAHLWRAPSWEEIGAVEQGEATP